VTHEGARDLLDRTHLFPGSYTIKAIGAAVDDFVGRTVGTAQGVLQRTADVRYTVRSTPDGNHVSVTLDLEVVSAEEVIQVYQALQVVKGMRFLL
jgi:putative lipoic acid-binding regulatory protein